MLQAGNAHPALEAGKFAVRRGNGRFCDAGVFYDTSRRKNAPLTKYGV
jgi:hypothetical protein